MSVWFWNVNDLCNPCCLTPFILCTQRRSYQRRSTGSASSAPFDQPVHDESTNTVTGIRAGGSIANSVKSAVPKSGNKYPKILSRSPPDGPDEEEDDDEEEEDDEEEREVYF